MNSYDSAEHGHAHFACNAGGARGVRTQPKKSFIPPETVAAVSRQLVDEPQPLAGLRLSSGLHGDLLRVRVLDHLRCDANPGHDVTHDVVRVVANAMRSGRPGGKVDDLSLGQNPFAVVRAQCRPSAQDEQQLLRAVMAVEDVELPRPERVHTSTDWAYAHDEQLRLAS